MLCICFQDVFWLWWGWLCGQEGPGGRQGGWRRLWIEALRALAGMVPGDWVRVQMWETIGKSPVSGWRRWTFLMLAYAGYVVEGLDLVGFVGMFDLGFSVRDAGFLQG